MNAPFEHVKEYELPKGGRLIIAPTTTKDVVIVQGSVLGGKRMVPSDKDVLPLLAAALLDAGTATKSKEQIRERLAARGMSLELYSSIDRTNFSGRCFPEDVATLLTVIAECLKGAAFPEREVKAEIARAVGALREEKTDTRAQAERAFLAQLYTRSHPNYVRSIEEEEKSLRATRRKELVDFRAILGRGGLILVVAGDVDAARIKAQAGKAFAALGVGTPAAEPLMHNTKKAEACEKHISLADKANVDVMMGASLPLTYASEHFFAMKVLTEMLGGTSFTSHLMQTIRERDGLTYGVYAQLAGLDGGADGYLKIWANFSPARYAHSVDMLKKEVSNFFSLGITGEALERNKERISGAYQVSLSTTTGLASVLHGLATQGRPLDYLETFPQHIETVTLDAVHAASDLIPKRDLSIVAAGTFPKN